MPRHSPARAPVRKRRPRPPLQPPRALVLWRWIMRFRYAPGFVQFIAGLAVVGALIPTTNWLYQVIRKPSELFFPVSDVLYKTPIETWRAYAPIFRAHSTVVMTPTLLAALAQVEASGNPVARTYWRWSNNPAPFAMYRPASSAVGMYQITDGTYAEARHYCIHAHRVVEDGPWDQLQSCWFNRLYLRVVPSHAVEMTSANLDRRVASTLQRRRILGATLRQKQDLAILTHLCGAGAAESYAARGLQLRPGQRSGDHDARSYLARVHAMEQVFAHLGIND